MKGVVEAVKDFAEKAHEGQMRKYRPDAYIVHPVRVMETCRRYTQDTSILCAALLHDVLEDTAVSAEEMLQFMLSVTDRHTATYTVQLVKDLTDVYVKDDYPKWNRRKRKTMELERLKKTSPDSQTIKYADIIDNCREIIDNDRDFAHIFLHECANILRYLDKGHKELYALAVQTVNKELGRLSV